MSRVEGVGEIQLEALLEHLLAPEQFARNVKIGDINARWWSSPCGFPAGATGK